MICERFIFNIQGFLYFQIKLIISNVSFTCCGRKSKDKVRKGDYKWIVILAIVAISANINQDQTSLHIWTDYFTFHGLRCQIISSKVYRPLVCPIPVNTFWILIPCLVHSTENGDSQVWSLMKEDLLSVFVSCSSLELRTCSLPRQHLVTSPEPPATSRGWIYN